MDSTQFYVYRIALLKQESQNMRLAFTKIKDKAPEMLLS